MKSSPALRSFLLGSTFLAASSVLHATILYWDGTSTTANADGGTGTWGTANAWDNAATGGANATWNNATPDSAVFGGAAATVTLSGPQTADSIRIDTGRYLITGSTLTINSGGITLSSGSGNLAPGSGGAASGLTDISSAVTLGASQTWTNNSSDTVLRQLTGNVALGAFTLTLKTTGNKAVNVAGTTSGTGNIIVDANSLGAMSGNNTYSGTTTIKSGATLTINSLADYNANSGLGKKSTNSASDLVIDGGTLRVQVNSATSNRQFTMGAGGATLEAFNTGVANSGQILLTNTSGAIAYTGIGNRTLTIGGNSDDAGGSIISLAIADVGGSNGTVGLVKNGSHAWTVNGTNSYTGGTTVSAGVLTTDSSSALGSTSGQLTVNTGGTLNMGSQNLTVGNLTGTGGVISGTSGSRMLTIGQGNGTGGNFQGEIANGSGGTTALTKTGTGTIILSGTNSYTGDTNVNEGTLIINGSTSSTSLVTVANGATLGGSGTVGGATTVNGYLKPGNSTGLLTVGSLDINSNASTVLEINGLNRGALSDGYDAININTGGSIDLAGALNFTFGNLSAFANNTEFDLFSFTTTSSGDFASVISTGFYSGTWIKSGDIWSLTDEGQTLNFSEVTGNLTVVPEPRASLLGGLGMLALIRRRRN